MSQDHLNAALEPDKNEMFDQEQEQDDVNQDDAQDVEDVRADQLADEPQQESEKEGHYGGGRYPRRPNILRIDYYEPEIPDDDEFLCEYF